jgi:hypothetical protein
MTETQTVTQVKAFDDVLAEFDNVEVQETSQFSAKAKTIDETIDEVDSEKEVKIDTIDKIVEEVENEEVTTEEVKPTSNVLNAISKLVEKGQFFLFDDKQNLEEYTEEELVELIQENEKYKSKEVVEKEVSQFFESLPEEIQIAAKYVADGGSDLKGLFKSLAEVEDIKSMDVKKDAESIIRNYYSALEWDDEDINDKISTLKDLGPEALEKESSKVKPKLDKMHEDVIQMQLQKQEKMKQAQIADMQKYLQNAAESIKKGELGEIKLDPKKQQELYLGLTQANYQSRKGIPTNKLGHLLEKYQFIEPDFNKIYKVMWLLEDEQSFFENFSKQKVNEETRKTVRTLKTEQGNKESSNEYQNSDSKVVKKTIKREPVNFMAGINK